MPLEIRQLKQMLLRANWILMSGRGKGSHSRWRHDKVDRRLTLAGNDGDDASRAVEGYVKKAIAESQAAEDEESQ